MLVDLSACLVTGPCVGLLQAVDRDHAHRQRVRNHQIQNYMYGQKVEIPARCDNGEGSYLFQHEPTSDLSLAPSSTVVSFDDITIYRIGGGKISFIISRFFCPIFLFSPTSHAFYVRSGLYILSITHPRSRRVCGRYVFPGDKHSLTDTSPPSPVFHSAS